jgi:hypothetical protein
MTSFGQHYLGQLAALHEQLAGIDSAARLLAGGVPTDTESCLRIDRLLNPSGVSSWAAASAWADGAGLEVERAVPHVVRLLHLARGRDLSAREGGEKVVTPAADYQGRGFVFLRYGSLFQPYVAVHDSDLAEGHPLRLLVPPADRVEVSGRKVFILGTPEPGPGYPIEDSYTTPAAAEVTRSYADWQRAAAAAHAPKPPSTPPPTGLPSDGR